MAVIEYSLYRVKFVLPHQRSLLHYEVRPFEAFLTALERRGEAETTPEDTWHIGNLALFSQTSGYFAIGRTTHSTLEKWDAATGNFVAEDQETSPYTHCVFDSELGFIGIARKTSLSATTNGIARRVEEVLSRSKQVIENEIRVELTPIPDPESFLRELANAYRVFRFTATFRGPNPFDADEYFQKPLSRLLNAADGQKGKAQLEGEDLNREALQAITKSTAATGNKASARLQRTQGAKSTRVQLTGNAVGTSYQEEQHDPKQVWQDLRGLYQNVRS